jgi:hypothetical protein
MRRAGGKLRAKICCPSFQLSGSQSPRFPDRGLNQLPLAPSQKIANRTKLRKSRPLFLEEESVNLSVPQFPQHFEPALELPSGLRGLIAGSDATEQAILGHQSSGRDA